jgi:hypothetical protein
LSPIPKSDRKQSIQLNRRLPSAGAAWLAVVAGLVAVAGDAPPQSAPAPWPVGKAVGAVAFDCVVEEDAPLAGAKTVMFLEYAVSPRAIAYSIVWAEPCWRAIHFPCPPIGTSLYADESSFVVRHALNDVEWRQSLPAEPRGRFMHTCGNYPLVDARIAYQEARGRRLTVSDMPELEANARSGGLGDGGGFGSPLPDRPGRPPTRISVSRIESEIIGFYFFTDGPLERRGFDYRLEEGRLKSILTESHEVTVPVGGFEIEAKTPEFPDGVVIEQLPARYHADGRIALVEFSPQSIGEVEVDLPERIRVGTQKRQVVGPDPLRRATMSNYRSLPEMPSAETIGSRFTTDPLFEREQTFRRLTAQHWNRPVAAVDPADAAWLQTFADDCLRMAREEPRLPVRLKLLFMSIASDLMLGNDSRVDSESLPSYLQALRDGGFGGIAEIAASQVADIRANWGRPEGDSEE